jgi:hypothetical protein
MDLLIQNQCKIVQFGSKVNRLDELPEGEYLASVEDEYLVEEDDDNNFIIQEPIT